MEYYARIELEKARTVVVGVAGGTRDGEGSGGSNSGGGGGQVKKCRQLEVINSNTSSRIVAMPSGRHLATSGDPVVVYDSSGAHIEALRSSHVRGGRMSAASDDILVTVDREGKLTLWSVSTRSEITNMRLRDRAVVISCWSSGLIGIGDEKGGITILRHSNEGRKIRHVHRFEVFETKVCYMDTSEELLVACSRDGKIAVIDKNARRCKAFFHAPYSGPCRVAVEKNHLVIATFGELRVYETNDSCSIRLIVSDAYPIDELRLPVLRIIGSYAFVGGVGDSGEINVICLMSGECLARLESPFAKLRSIDVNIDGRIVVSSAEFNHYGFALFRASVPLEVEQAISDYVTAKYRNNNSVISNSKSSLYQEKRNFSAFMIMAAFAGCVAMKLLKQR